MPQIDGHRSYIPDRNPFHLPAPSAWWLRGLAAFDPDLVVLPSRIRPVYLLARRRTLTADVPSTLPIDLDADSALLRAHHLLSVTWFASTEGLTEGLLLYLCQELAARDTWAINGRPMTTDDLKIAFLNGGVTKYTRLIDEADAAARTKLNQSVREDLWHASGEAWRLKQYLTGERSRPTIAAPAPATSASSMPDATPAGAAETPSDVQAFAGV
jgi:hypothetical protein